MVQKVLEDAADFVIVGTGAGGATAARVLTEAGHSVVLLEEGPSLPTEARPRDALGAMSQSFRGFATTATAGAAPMPLLQGCMVGGSTAINSGIIWRMPDDVRCDWTQNHGVGVLVDDRALRRIFEQIEDELEIVEVPRALRGGNAVLMERASEALGLPGTPIHRNAARCRGSAQCLQGCPGEARQSMDVSYVPRALKSGARLYDRARVRRVLVERGRAVGVTGDLVGPERARAHGRFRIRARRAVIVACGAVQTPVLLWKSGLRRMVGQGFQAHPGAAVVGRFDERVTMGFGVTQAYEVPMRSRGYKLESLSLPPEMLAARLPGVGADWQRRLADLDHYAQWATQVRMKARGRVRPGLGGRPVVRFEPKPQDLERVRESVALICRMMFAVGATEVYPGLGRIPEVLTDSSQVEQIDALPLARRDYHLVASHLFGTACAGADPQRSVVGPDLQSHELPGLYVMDASVFPTNMGANPQHSIMAVVWRAAEWLAGAKPSHVVGAA